MNFPVGANSLDSFFKAYKTEEKKCFFPYEWFDNPDTLKNKELPQYGSLVSKLREITHLEKGYNDCENLTTSTLSSEQAVASYGKTRYLQQVMKLTHFCGESV